MKAYVQVEDILKQTPSDMHVAMKTSDGIAILITAPEYVALRRES